MEPTGSWTSVEGRSLASLVQGGGRTDREEIQVCETAVRTVEPCGAGEERMEVATVFLKEKE